MANKTWMDSRKTMNPKNFSGYCIQHKTKNCKTCHEQILISSNKQSLNNVEMLKLISERYKLFAKIEGVPKKEMDNIHKRTQTYLLKVPDSFSETEIDEYFLTKTNEN